MSPGSARARLAALNADPKFKKYVAQVDKCLQTFDNAHEWADFIAFLTKLLKTFQSFPQYKETPRKLIVAKRLSQCLNPALPTGVHQRALDVYTHILTVSGTEGLKQDLQLWSSGLFPFFEYAATSVKPTLLNIYDTYYLPLQSDLRSIMKASILALLPGLEEETGDFFDKVFSLLDKLSGTVSPAFFLQNMWVIMIMTPKARRTSLNFLSRRLPKLSGDDDISPIIGRDIGLMIRAFAAALEDDDILVRRSMLDLLEQTLPLNSISLKRAPATDQRLLMSAASDVVLRRDLSLNRRLYTWLLGSGTEDEQTTFFRVNGLELLRSTLKNDMSIPRPDPKPFKVFISLLDKWEIGGPLVDVLLYDAFKSLKDAIVKSSDGSLELLVAANSLYDSVEPSLVWRHFFLTAQKEILESNNSECESLSMIRFILDRFRVQEDEVKNVHLAMLYPAFVELSKVIYLSNDSAMPEIFFKDIFQTLSVICKHVSDVGLTRSLPLNEEASGPYVRACKFYEIPLKENTIKTPFATRRSNVPIITSFEDLAYLTMVLTSTLATSDKQILLENACIQSFDLLSSMATRLSEKINVAWNPKIWTSNILLLLESVTSFVLVDSIVSTLITVGSSQLLHPRINLNNRVLVGKIIEKLLEFLRPDFAFHRVRVVQLLWTIENITGNHHLESLFAQTLTSNNSYSSFESFGVFWRFTEDALLPGFKFKLPLFIILDTLKNPDPELRGMGETWMRCNMKSYIRILEPLLFDLLDPSVIRVPNTRSYHGYEVLIFQYEKKIDQSQIEHLLETLHSVVKFGGQALGRVARNAQYRASLSVEFVKRIDNANIVSSENSYMDVLLEILFRYLQSEPVLDLRSIMQYTNIRIHSTVLDLIQALILRGDFSSQRLQLAGKAIIEKLCLSVHGDRYDLQNKILHLLHSILSGLSAAQDSRMSNNKFTDSAAPSLQDLQVHPLLLPTLLDGIQKNAGLPILQHWLDFVLMTVPQFPRLLNYTVTPLSDCLCRQLWSVVTTLTRVVQDTATDIRANITDTEVIMLLNTLERLVILGLAKGSELQTQEREEEIAAEKSNVEPSGGSSGILGIVTNVFTSDASVNTSEEALSIQSPGYQALLEAIRILYTLWALTSLEPSRPGQDPVSFTYTRIKLRSRKVLERFLHTHSREVMESIVDCWHQKSQVSSSAVAFDIMDALTSSSQTAVHLLCEGISVRSAGIDKGKRFVINPNISDITILSFLEEYFSRLEGPVAIQVWNRFMSLTKEVLSNVQAYSSQVFPVLRCMTVLNDKVTQTTAIEDRKLRKELQDTYLKLLDNCTLIVGRSFDQGTWLRRNTKDLVVNGRSSPMPSDNISEEKGSASYDIQAQTTSIDVTDKVITYLASHVIPNLRRYLFESDKVVTMCTNIVYYIVNPAIKVKTGRVFDLDYCVFELLFELSKIPLAAKAWKGPILDVFVDNRFFNFPPEMGIKWMPLISAYVKSDKQSISEILAKVPSTSSGNIFSNREAEALSRAMNLRRLSYTLFAGEKNYFLTQLPSIQEKLVDVLRNQNPGVMKSEVYLCLRVLLLRLSPHNMSSFWPVVLTELLRIFDDIFIESPPDQSDELRVILSACKFLDLVLTLQTEEFQIHQWMFITDTVDAVYRPDSSTSEALFDQLADMVRDLAAPKKLESGPLDTALPIFQDKLDSALSTTESVPVFLRKPFLSHVQRIRSIRDLLPFFSHISIASYEAMYHSMGNIDWRAVESYLLEDLFDAIQ